MTASQYATTRANWIRLGYRAKCISVAGSGTNTVIIDAATILRLSETDVPRVRAGSDDTVTANGAWVAGADIDIDSSTYKQYSLGGATLQIENTAIQEIGGVHALANLNSASGVPYGGAAGDIRSGTCVAGDGGVTCDSFDDLDWKSVV